MIDPNRETQSPAFTAGREAWLFGRPYEPGRFLLLRDCEDYRAGWKLERLDCRDIKKRMPLIARRLGK